MHDSVASPLVLPNRPAEQFVQLPCPPALNWPAAQMEAVALVDPAGQAYPAVQLAAQGAARDTSELHRPAAHDAHVPAPLVLNWPASHMTAVALVDPAGQAYPAVHMTAVALVDPAGHANPEVQLEAQGVARDTSALHRPAAHGVHAPA